MVGGDVSEPAKLVQGVLALRALGRLRKPPVDAIGTYAVHAVRRHTDQTHEAVLALIDELLTIGVRDDRVSARVVAARARALDTAA